MICQQEVKNNYTFQILNPTLSIHHSLLWGYDMIQGHLQVKFFTIRWFSAKNLSRFGAKFGVWWGKC